MVPWQNQHMSPTYLLNNSKYTWKLLVMMHHGLIKITKDTTESYTKFQQQALLAVINTQKKISVQHRHNQKLIDAKSTVYQTTPHLNLHFMVKILASMNLEYLDVVYTPSPQLLKIYMTEQKKDRYRVTLTEQIQ